MKKIYLLQGIVLFIIMTLPPVKLIKYNYRSGEKTNLNKNITKKSKNTDISIVNNENINKNDIYNSAIKRQTKIDNNDKSTSKVIVDNNDVAQSNIDYSYNITYSIYNNNSKISNISTKTITVNGFSHNLVLGENDNGMGSEGAYIPTSEVQNIYVQINGAYQPKVHAQLSPVYLQQIKYAMLTNNKNTKIWYTIQASGILSCPRILLIGHWNDSNGKTITAPIGEFGVYNFYNTNGGWAISLMSIFTPMVLTSFAWMLNGITTLGVLGIIKGINKYFLSNNIDEYMRVPISDDDDSTIVSGSDIDTRNDFELFSLYHEQIQDDNNIENETSFSHENLNSNISNNSTNDNQNFSSNNSNEQSIDESTEQDLGDIFIDVYSGEELNYQEISENLRRCKQELLKLSNDLKRASEDWKIFCDENTKTHKAIRETSKSIETSIDDTLLQQLYYELQDVKRQIMSMDGSIQNENQLTYSLSYEIQNKWLEWWGDDNPDYINIKTYCIRLRDTMDKMRTEYSRICETVENEEIKLIKYGIEIQNIEELSIYGFNPLSLQQTILDRFKDSQEFLDTASSHYLIRSRFFKDVSDTPEGLEESQSQEAKKSELIEKNYEKNYYVPGARSFFDLLDLYSNYLNDILNFYLNIANDLSERYELLLSTHNNENIDYETKRQLRKLSIEIIKHKSSIHTVFNSWIDENFISGYRMCELIIDSMDWNSCEFYFDYHLNKLNISTLNNLTIIKYIFHIENITEMDNYILHVVNNNIYEIRHDLCTLKEYFLRVKNIMSNIKYDIENNGINQQLICDWNSQRELLVKIKTEYNNLYEELLLYKAYVKNSIKHYESKFNEEEGNGDYIENFTLLIRSYILFDENSELLEMDGVSIFMENVLKFESADVKNETLLKLYNNKKRWIKIYKMLRYELQEKYLQLYELPI